MANIRSVLKPEGSVMAGIAVAGSVWALYNLSVGTVSQAHATNANNPILESTRKKAGLTGFLFVSTLGLITRDGNILILGYLSIVAMEIHYRHAIMADPQTGTIVPPAEAAYQPAQNVVPITQAADPSAVGF